jgi:toxin ParE1/3/4
MSVVWTQRAFADLDFIYDAIVADRSRVAERVVRTLMTHAERLSRYPRRGRPGRLPDTRELVVPKLPYIIVHALVPSLISTKPDVAILRVIHGAMQWPPERQPSLGF